MRKLALLVAMLAMVLAAAAPAFAGQGGGGGATSEEFVCFRSTGDKIQLGTGKVVTTPSGNVNVVCTGQPLWPTVPSRSGLPGSFGAPAFFLPGTGAGGPGSRPGVLR